MERSPLKILGTCDPALAHRALELDPSVSVVLPCNVVVEATDHGTRVVAVDPHDLIDEPRFKELADAGADRLRAAVEHVAGGGGSPGR